jgi:hypothetical protein
MGYIKIQLTSSLVHSVLEQLKLLRCREWRNSMLLLNAKVHCDVHPYPEPAESSSKFQIQYLYDDHHNHQDQHHNACFDHIWILISRPSIFSLSSNISKSSFIGHGLSRRSVWIHSGEKSMRVHFRPLISPPVLSTSCSLREVELFVSKI